MERVRLTVKYLSLKDDLNQWMKCPVDLWGTMGPRLAPEKLLSLKVMKTASTSSSDSGDYI